MAKQKQNKIADIFNTYPVSSKFTVQEFIKEYIDYFEQAPNMQNVRVTLSRMVVYGFIDSEKIQQNGRGRRIAQYTKLCDVKEEQTPLLSYAPSILEKKRKSSPKSKRVISPIPKSPDALISIKHSEWVRVKEIMQKQHNALGVLKKQKADLIDENTALNTNLTVLTETTAALKKRIKLLEKATDPKKIISSADISDLKKFESHLDI